MPEKPASSVDMSPRKFRALLASYGGGHAQMIAPVAQALLTQGHDLDLIGLTTGYRYFERAGLPAQSVLGLLDPDPDADASYRAAVQPFLSAHSHADISPAETEAYFTFGLRDLAEQHGLTTALEMVQAQGRKAFTPVSGMQRYLERVRPDVVVATTSPRFELALLRAARRLGIPSVSISDLFLVREREWILAEDYAEHLTVISPIVAESLRVDGLTGTQLHVTGNPAFDVLEPLMADEDRRAGIRRRLGLADRMVILWPTAPLGSTGRDQRPYAAPRDVVSALETVCRRDPRYAYLLRPHPNSPFEMPEGAHNGLLDQNLLSPEDALLVADIVCVEVSTMGLQAALLGKPVVCVGFADDAVYPGHGLAHAVDTLQGVVDLILAGGATPRATSFNMPQLGTATANVTRLLNTVALSAT